MRKIKSETLDIDEVYSYQESDYHIEGQITIDLIDGSDLSHNGHGPYFYTEVDHSLNINPFNEEVLDAFIEEKEVNFD